MLVFHDRTECGSFRDIQCEDVKTTLGDFGGRLGIRVFAETGCPLVVVGDILPACTVLAMVA